MLSLRVAVSYPDGEDSARIMEFEVKSFKIRAGAVVTTAGLVLMGAGAATAQANNNNGDSPRGDRPPCVSYERGDVWQQTKPEGDGWRNVRGESRVVPAVEEVEGQAFVAAVPGSPAIPQVEHTDYKYERDIEGDLVTSPWLLEMPAQGDGYPWVQKEITQEVNDPPSTAPISLIGGVLTVNHTIPTQVGIQLRMYLFDKDLQVSTGYIAESMNGTITYSGSDFPAGPWGDFQVVTGHAYEVKIAKLGYTWTLPVTATSGQHTEYQYERPTKIHEVKWQTEEPDGLGWVQTASNVVIDHAAVPEVLAVAEIPFIAHVEGVDAYTEYRWTRRAKDCSTDGHDYTTIVLKLCHKTGSTYAVKTITLRTVRDARSITGHAADIGDIIPAFEFGRNADDRDWGHGDRDAALFVGGDRNGDRGRGDHDGYTYLGLNLDTVANRTLLANDCKVPVVAPTVTPAAPVIELAPVVVLPAEAVLPAGASAGQVDTNGQVVAGGLAGFAAFLMLGAGSVLRRRRCEV